MKKNALFILNKESGPKIYSQEDIERVEKLTNINLPMYTADEINNKTELLADCNIILSGWGGPCIDKQFLEKAPNLEAVFYGAGSIRRIVTPEFWQKDIIITSAWAANAIPVAEYTFAQIILCLKNTYKLNQIYCNEFPQKAKDSSDISLVFNEMSKNRKVFGTYKTTVGIISLGMIGKFVCELLKSIDVKVVAYDPFIKKEEALSIGVELVELDELFKISHVVSLHAPLLSETVNMICAKHFEVMMEDAFFINTARGAIVNEVEMISVLKKRPDLTAILDVTYPEPPDIDSDIFTMQNVFLTPHIAGSMDSECMRMGKFAVDEMERYLNGEQLKYQITKKQFDTLA